MGKPGACGKGDTLVNPLRAASIPVGNNSIAFGYWTLVVGLAISTRKLR